MRRDISLTLPLSRAVEHVKRLLFQPFDPAKWFVIGFCAWLARLGEGGFQFGYRNNSSFGRAATLPNFQHWFEQGRSYVLVNLAWIVPLAATIVVAALAIWIVILWLNSRGHFMFLYCVALERGEVRTPWNRYRQEANSLFLFRLVMTLGGFLVAVLPAAGIGLFLVPLLPSGAATVTGIIAIVGLALVSMFFLLVWTVVAKLTRDFIVPIQFVRGCGWREAWGALIGLITQNLAGFVLYFLFQIVLAIAIFFVLLQLSS